MPGIRRRGERGLDPMSVRKLETYFFVEIGGLSSFDWLVWIVHVILGSRWNNVNRGEGEG